MVPGKTNVSLTVAWALDHDPLDAIREAMSNLIIPEESEEEYEKIPKFAETTPQRTYRVSQILCTHSIWSVEYTNAYDTCNCQILESNVLQANSHQILL